MCGISLFVYSDNDANKVEEWMKKCEIELIKRGERGQFQRYTIKTMNFNFSFLGSVLSMRTFSKQPIVTENGILLFNGEIFDSPFEIKQSENDVFVLSTQLEQCKNEDEIQKVINSVKGPYSFIYLSLLFKKLYFGRSFFGHRVNNNHSFCSIQPFIKRIICFFFLLEPSHVLFQQQKPQPQPR